MTVLKKKEVHDPINGSVIGTLELVELSPYGDYSVEVCFNGLPIKKCRNRSITITFYERYTPKIDHKKFKFNKKGQKWELKNKLIDKE